MTMEATTTEATEVTVQQRALLPLVEALVPQRPPRLEPRLPLLLQPLTTAVNLGREANAVKVVGDDLAKDVIGTQTVHGWCKETNLCEFNSLEGPGS